MKNNDLTFVNSFKIERSILFRLLESRKMGSLYSIRVNTKAGDSTVKAWGVLRCAMRSRGTTVWNEKLGYVIIDLRIALFIVLLYASHSSLLNGWYGDVLIWVILCKLHNVDSIDFMKFVPLSVNICHGLPHCWTHFVKKARAIVSAVTCFNTAIYWSNLSRSVNITDHCGRWKRQTPCRKYCWLVGSLPTDLFLPYYFFEDKCMFYVPFHGCPEIS